TVLQYLPSAVRAVLTRPLYQTSQGDSEGMEFRIVLNEPISRTVRVLLATVRDQARENVKGIAITVQDITREVALNEAKSQFISNVSHELRTPLFNIKSFIETLHEYGEDLSERERQEFLETANHETDRLTRLVNDVLDLSRLESNRRYALTEVDIAQPMEQTLRTYKLNAKEKQILLVCDLEADLPPVMGNYDLLLQIFVNLVGNSLKFTQPGGKMMLRAYQLSSSHQNSEGMDFIRVEIADTGIGIAAEDQAAIFDRFFRVENRVHTLEGTGLGLSIVKNIIDKHNSRVHLVSEVGIGTTFWFDLPVYDAAIENRTDKIDKGDRAEAQAASALEPEPDEAELSKDAAEVSNSPASLPR
ncbi:MAG: HAMP domain-containing sensor histidine kinase, partial [Cyanobacteria bacterium P01_C01_bin.73]